MLNVRIAYYDSLFAPRGPSDISLEVRETILMQPIRKRSYVGSVPQLGISNESPASLVHGLRAPSGHTLLHVVDTGPTVVDDILPGRISMASTARRSRSYVVDRNVQIGVD